MSCSNLALAWFALFAKFHLVCSARTRDTGMHHENNSLCIGCKSYPEADDYDDDWRKNNGIRRTKARLEAESEDETLTPEQKAKAMQMSLEMTVHAIFNVLQGQMCMDLCAVCIPSKEDLMTGQDPKLNSIQISRAKNWQDASVWPVMAPVDGALGGMVGALGAIPVSLAGFFGGGTITGLATGVGTSSYIANKSHSSFAGNILGSIAGVSTGLVSGSVLAVLGELLGLSFGLWKGIGITAATTDCKRVGFKRSTDGIKHEEQPFASKKFKSQYGLKRLRQWMKDNKDWKTDTALKEIFPGDEQAVKHCERVREHSFDMRHASECLKHSQLCGPRGSVILPASTDSLCRSVSNLTWLEATAVAMGDNEKDGFFATWRKFQQEIRDESGYDGKKTQCIKTLCEYDGFRRASMKLHPDRLVNKNIPDDEKVRLGNIFRFLSSCKSEYLGSDGKELVLNNKEERDIVCASIKIA